MRSSSPHRRASKPVIINIDGLFLLTSPAEAKSYGAEREHTNAQLAKTVRIGGENGTAEVADTTGEERQDSQMSLVEQIVDNLQVPPVSFRGSSCFWRGFLGGGALATAYSVVRILTSGIPVAPLCQLSATTRTRPARSLAPLLPSAHLLAQLVINNVHIRHEDHISVPERPFASGITLGRIHIIPTNASGTVAFVSEQQEVAYKILDMENFAVRCFWLALDRCETCPPPPTRACRRRHRSPARVAESLISRRRI